ncbi:MAG: class I SAM-dependent methyltransferase [Planctomycetota bacterium]|nr:class I SAM-dependent methyltransferase [Planctomycetota bacterium]
MSTQAFYEANAAKYFDKTLALDVSGVRGRFLEYVPKGGKLLDAGSGSGRDSRAFKDAGYSVGAFDSSPALARLSTEYSGVPTQVCTFQAFHSESDYDGIWACAALLHLRMTEVPAAVRNLKKALRPGGAIYMSFKYGTSERIAPDGRHFFRL